MPFPYDIRDKGESKMSNIFVINEKTYVAKPFNFGLICDLEDLGVSLEDIDKIPFKFMRTYFYLCGKFSSIEQASEEINAHVVNGGSMDVVFDVITKEMEESDFFRAISKTEEKKTPTSQSKKKSKTSVTTEA